MMRTRRPLPRWGRPSSAGGRDNNDLNRAHPAPCLPE